MITHGQVSRLINLAERFVVALETLAAQGQGEPLKGQAHGNPDQWVRDGGVVVPSIPEQPGFDGKGKPKKGKRK